MRLTLVLVLTAIFHLGALGGEPVYDDRAQILNDPTIRSWSGLDDAFRRSVWQFAAERAEPAGLYYRPLFHVAFALNYALFGFDLVGWHLTSLLIHLAVTALAYRLARDWGAGAPVALFAALLFGLHPVHSESVAWISGLPDPLAALGVLGALAMHERARRATTRGRWAWIAAGFALAVLAMLAKEVALALPLFLVARELIEARPGERRAERIGRALRSAAPCAVAAAVVLAMRWSVLGFVAGVEPRAAAVPLASAIATVPAVVLFYARLLAFPFPLMIVYPLSFVPTFAAPAFWLPAVAVVVLAAAAIRATSGRPVARTALALAVVFLLPALHLRAFNPEESLVHDRYLYLPSVGFCLVVALAFAELAGRAPSRRRWVALAALALAAVYGLLTAAQNRTWRDDGRLAEHALLRQPRSPFLQNFLGRYRVRQGELVDAERLLRAAAEAAPAVGNYQLDLAGLLASTGRREEAEAAFERALARGATSALTFLNLGVTYLAQGRLAEGEAALEEARARQPANARIHVLLGWIAEQRGHDAAAEAAYREAVRLEPAAGEPRLRLGLWLARQGRDAEAMPELEAAQKALPREPELLLGLAGLHLRGRRCAEAVAILETLVALVPEHDRAHASLGLAYECLGDFARAAAAFRRAVAVGPETPSGRIARERLAALPPGS